MTFPFSLTDPVRFAGPQPQACDVAILGGGVIGVMTALFLARQGLRVTLLEKGRIAAEQSSRNWGWIRAQGRDPAELPLAMEARSLWQQLARDCGEEIGLRQTGVTYLARRPAQLEEFETFTRLAQAHDLDTRMLTGSEVAQMFPALDHRYAGGMTTPSDMRGEPWVAVPAIARLAAREGVCIVENCAVRTLDVAAGRVAGVWTEQGLLRADSVLVAGGAWSSLFLRNAGVVLPQLSVRCTVAATGPLPDVHDGAVTEGTLALRRRLDGGYTLAAGGSSQLYVGPDAFRHMLKYLPALREDPLAVRYHPMAPAGYPDGWTTARRWGAQDETPFERMRILNPTAERRALTAMTRALQRLLPSLPQAPLARSWAGMIDAMPDAVPVLDHVPALPGLTIATGMSGHGFGIGPAMGRVAADLIAGRAPGHDLQRFRFGRFTDGSAIHPGPAL